MTPEKKIKQSFVVIGKEGSTLDGDGFIQKMWSNANAHFEQVAHLAKRNSQGALIGIWGAMSDLSRSFHPWEHGFTQGLYLAGVECNDNAEAPQGWIKWIIPAYEYLYVENTGPQTFSDFIQYLQQNNIPLVGAAHDFSCPATGKQYIYFPIRQL